MPPASNKAVPSLLTGLLSDKWSLLQDWLGELPDELLCGILQLSWSLDKRERTPAEEVRCALQLRSVCQRADRLLRARPLPLRLDFSRPLGVGTEYELKHAYWLASAAQQDSVASLTLPRWDMSRGQRLRRGQRSAMVNGMAWLYLTPPLLQILAGNQQRSLKQLYGVNLSWERGGIWQVNLSAFALTHVGLVLPGWYQGLVCIAALPVTMESLACCPGESYEAFEKGAHAALLENARPCPCLARIHVKCDNMILPSSTAGAWCGKQIVITAEHFVKLDYDARLKGELGPFGAAVSVRIEAGCIMLASLHVTQLRAFARKLCPDTLGEAVLECCFPDRVFLKTAPWFGERPNYWREVLSALICERGDLFAFEVDTRYGRTRCAWRRWPPRGTHAHEAAAELHSQATKWAGLGA